MNKSIPAIMVAGTHSGCGKTSAALGLMAALKEKGLEVAPFKVGPDFIDPGYHEVLCQRPSYNLDTWMNDDATVRQIFLQGSRGADIAVIEGVMGLFDGAAGQYGPGASAHVAKVLGVPVLLVVDSSHMAASIAALIKGFIELDPEVKFAGVLINQVASPRHEHIIKKALEKLGLEWYAYMPRNQEINIPSRHLGLVTIHDQQEIKDLFSNLASWVKQYCDIEGLLKTLADSPFPASEPSDSTLFKERICSDGPVIGIARDEAFCFYYQTTWDLLASCGAKLAFFSPLRDKQLPPNVQALYFGGGYPELYAKKLSENNSMLKAVQKASISGMPIYGECGGFIYLCKGILDEDGKRFPWCSIFPFWTKMEKRFQALGYREVTIVKDSILGSCGSKLRGHEFHYSRLMPIKDEPVPEQIYQVKDAEGNPCSSGGWIINKTLGSYIHLHFGSHLDSVQEFIRSAAAYG